VIRLRSIVQVGSGGLDAAQDAIGSQADAILLSVADARVPLAEARQQVTACWRRPGRGRRRRWWW
jgi:hypothetical protein